MRTYKGTTVKVGGILEMKVEMWTEHNHSTIYNESGDCLFDGYFCDAYIKFNEEVEKLINNAKAHGFTAEIVNN